jgi:Fungal Zn(2)-Cys(6) binuclear cluster domain
VSYPPCRRLTLTRNHRNKQLASDTNYTMSSIALGQQASPNSNLSPQSEEGWSEESDAQVEVDGSRKRRRTTRPLSVSCETCKQRKVKCDRGQPACGWCGKNSQRCEYKERKKPGLRAGYGRELESKLAEQAAMIGESNSISLFPACRSKTL